MHRALRSEFISQPKVDSNPEEDRAQKRKKKRDTEKSAFGTYGGGASSIVTYRQKVGMSYKIVKEKVGGSNNRESLLDKRMKKKSDRMCVPRPARPHYAV